MYFFLLRPTQFLSIPGHPDRALRVACQQERPSQLANNSSHKSPEISNVICWLKGPLGVFSGQHSKTPFSLHTLTTYAKMISCSSMMAVPSPNICFAISILVHKSTSTNVTSITKPGVQLPYA